MKTRILSIIVFLLLLLSTSFIQGQKPVQDTDYQFTYTTDEETDEYLVVSYYLENLSSEKIMFFSFFFADALDGQEIWRDLPEDVLILEPGEKQIFVKFKTYSTSLRVNWVADFMRYSDEIEQATLNRDYVYFYEYSSGDDEVSYTYRLKNISDQGIMFYDFTRGEDSWEIDIWDDIPISMFALRPGESKSYLRYDVDVGAATLSTNWWANA